MNDNININAENEPSLPSLRSRDTKISVQLTFINNTERKADVYWIDFKGKYVHYKQLLPGQGLRLNTYETHPWVFLDHATKASLVVLNKRVFLPQYIERDGEPLPVAYRITIPLYSLKERAIQALVASLGCGLEGVLAQLPYTLQQEVQRCLTPVRL